MCNPSKMVKFFGSRTDSDQKYTSKPNISIPSGFTDKWVYRRDRRMFLAGTFSEENQQIRDNPLFTGNPPENTDNTQNKPIKARTGNLTANSPKSHHNLFYRSFLAFKTWHIFLIFNRSFLGILPLRSVSKLIFFVPKAIGKVKRPLLEKVRVFCWFNFFPLANLPLPLFDSWGWYAYLFTYTKSGY